MADDKRAGGKLLSFTKRIEERVLQLNHEGVAGSGEGAELLALVKPLQERFQREHCPSCAQYDPTTGEYRKTGHVNDAEDCHWHWTDVLGVCENYRRRHDDAVPDEYALEIFLQSIRPF